MLPRFTTSTAVDFKVVNGLGVVLLSTSDGALARKRAKAFAEQHEGVEVREITTVTNSRRFYRPPAPKPDPLAVPPMGQAVRA